MIKQVRTNNQYSLNGIVDNHLLAKIEAVFKSINIDTRFNTVTEIISSDDNSEEFIREVLQDEKFHSVRQNSTIYKFAKNRAQHSVLTFFIGLVFLEFCDFEEIIAKTVLNSKPDKDVIVLWMLTALYHDWAYFSEDINKADLDYSKITRYELLTDTYEKAEWLEPIQHFSLRHQHVLAYSYEEIKAYDKYARYYHANNSNDTEKVDHGILGGIKIFDRLAKRIHTALVPPQNNLLLLAKIACLTIAQHNIFKSNSKVQDQEYGQKLKKLHSNSAHKISMDTPLLLLLSLVDTFECIKRFGKSKNVYTYLQKSTVLCSISIEINAKSLIIDYSALASKIQEKDKRLDSCFQEYWKAMCTLDYWTEFIVEAKSNCSITIRLA